MIIFRFVWLAALPALLLACSSRTNQGRAPASTRQVFAVQGAVMEEQPLTNRHPLLDYKFTNELGQAVSLGQFKGQALAITFFFTRCPIPDFCPRLSKNFEE